MGFGLLMLLGYLVVVLVALSVAVCAGLVLIRWAAIREQHRQDRALHDLVQRKRQGMEEGKSGD